MKRPTAVVMPLALLAMFAGTVFAQDQKKDTVTVAQKGGTKRYAGIVLAETWKVVEIDTSGDGRSDASFPIDEVTNVNYYNIPQYLMETQKLSFSPKEIVDKLTRAYNDDITRKPILQHAYYQLAKAWVAQAQADATLLPKAVEAYQKLFTKFPDTRYAVTGRTELGNLLVSLGKPEQAVAPFKELADGAFGPAAAQRGKLLMARAQMAAGRNEDAEKSLTELSQTTKMDVEMTQEVSLLRSRSLVGQQKLDDAWRAVQEVLKGAPSPKVLGMAYGVMGDYFAAKENYKAALAAYLKVPLMYGEADVVERTHAADQAAAMLQKLGRAKEIETLKKATGS